jgi:hypothetical protein
MRLQEAEREREGFNEAVAKYSLRVFHRNAGGPEIDVTAENRKNLDDAVHEYRLLLRACSH